MAAEHGDCRTHEKDERERKEEMEATVKDELHYSDSDIFMISVPAVYGPETALEAAEAVWRRT